MLGQFDVAVGPGLFVVLWFVLVPTVAIVSQVSSACSSAWRS